MATWQGVALTSPRVRRPVGSDPAGGEGVSESAGDRVPGWVAVGGAKNVKVERLRNDIVDVSFAGHATYFDGLLSADVKATELYLDWRHWEADVTCHSTGANCSGTASIGAPAQKLPTESFDSIIGGARVKF